MRRVQSWTHAVYFFLKNPQANYFCRRKFLLVNGTHTTLAFMTLCMRQPRQSPNEVRTPLCGCVSYV